MGDACSRCDGIGSIRIRTGNGGQRVPCPECGGSGQMRPGPECGGSGQMRPGPRRDNR